MKLIFIFSLISTSHGSLINDDFCMFFTQPIVTIHVRVRESDNNTDIVHNPTIITNNKTNIEKVVYRLVVWPERLF